MHHLFCHPLYPPLSLFYLIIHSIILSHPPFIFYFIPLSHLPLYSPFSSSSYPTLYLSHPPFSSSSRPLIRSQPSFPSSSRPLILSHPPPCPRFGLITIMHCGRSDGGSRAEQILWLFLSFSFLAWLLFPLPNHVMLSVSS